MRKPQGYSYTTFDPALGEAGFRPLLPITLDYQNRSVQANGLLDTGATLSSFGQSIVILNLFYCCYSAQV